MEISFPISSAPGQNSAENGGRLINAHVEYAPEGSRSKYRWASAPGLTAAKALGSGDFRGALKFGSTLVVVNDDDCWSLDSDYTETVISTGGITNDGDPVIMARNMRATPQIMLICGDGTAFKIESGAATSFTDSDLPAPNSVCFKDGYFFFGIGDGRCFASGLNDVTVSSLDWTRAESSPDALVRVFPIPAGLVLAGENSSEIFANTANPSGFPFSRSTVLPFGLFGKYAVTGFEEGFTGAPLMVDNGGIVRQIIGYADQPVSTPAVEKLINDIADRNTLIASCYMMRGQPIYVLSCADWTLEFLPASTKGPAHWAERRSYGSSRWRVGTLVNAFDKWLALDVAGNAILEVTPGRRYEDTDPLIWKVRSTQMHRFPARATIWKASFDMQTGVGNDTGAYPIETNPQIGIALSFDGGRTFGNPWLRSLGTQGQITPIDVNRCGNSKRFGVQWELTVSDPVEVTLYGGAMDIEERAA